MRLRILFLILLCSSAFGADRVFFYDYVSDTSDYGTLSEGREGFTYSIEGEPRSLSLSPTFVREFKKAEDAIVTEAVWEFDDPEHDKSKLYLDPAGAMIWIDEANKPFVGVVMDQLALPPLRPTPTNLLSPVTPARPRTHLELLRYYVIFSENNLKASNEIRLPRFSLEASRNALWLAVRDVQREMIHGQRLWVAKVVKADEYDGLFEPEAFRFIPLSTLRRVSSDEKPPKIFNDVVYDSSLFWSRFPEAKTFDDTCRAALEAIIDAGQHHLP